ncbi:hypothetical protein OK351_06565 [Glutamicibacter sp. MNS18]|uniref:hypothetical protein n=1 Tax=Glutamicibacter sp. MNS18 TaxID=2989817 RepID=UPI00223690C6|nr:hypothetical protein [Glutamicibacter sp. MNS18]MCW4465164.1 hypothetical protein [Glutamicibacter sp. MNS18]
MKLPLHENERVVIKTRAHARVLRQPLIMLLLLTGGCAFALGFLSRETLPDWLESNTGVLSWMCLLLWFLLLMIWCAAPLWRWARGWIVLTTERILFRSAVAHGDLQAIGLYSVRDLVAHTRKKGAPQLPGTLDVLLHNGFVRISHVPAVAYFRELAIDVMRDAGANRPLVNRDGHPSGEGNNR